MTERITEIVKEFKVGHWGAEVFKREDGEHCMEFGYGVLRNPNDVYQGNEVMGLLNMIKQVDKFINAPMNAVSQPEPVKPWPSKVPPAPTTKQELINILNNGGIQDIICQSEFDDGKLTFAFIITTHDNRSFYFSQDFDLKPSITPMEIMDYTTGNGRELGFDMGAGFTPGNHPDLNINPEWENME